MLDIFKDKIQSLLRRRDYKPQKLSELAEVAGATRKDYPQFKEAFEQLRRAGQVVIDSDNLVMLPAMSGKLIGTFRANPKGFGFVIPLEPTAHGDLFIPPSDTAGAMTGDIVEARVVKKGRRQGQIRYSGQIVTILERSQNRFVGTLLREKKQWYVQPDGSAFTEHITVDDVSAKNAREKDKVVVEILTYPSERFFAHGVILEVLGRAGQYDAEIASIIRQYHLPQEFDPSSISHARKVADAFDPDSATGREDITGKVIATIDPPDAKDFDDAISIEKDADGNRILGIHIADVSTFVTEDSPLDTEAYERGNSIYLPRKTIPMLPEILSNGICSLQPNQKRFCKSVYITYDSRGEILSRRFASSIMESTARLTYINADRICKGHKKDFPSEVINLVKDMESLARTIEARRRRNGMLHLALPETELIYDDAGRVIDAEPADDSYPHTIIEMFMVEANEAVAGLIDRLDIPFIRRIHPDPNDLAMKELSKLIKTVGLSLPKIPDRFDVQSLLKSVHGKDCELAVNLLVLKSFEKAEYSPLNMGHYALASRHYCHFTSPIRRYADLTVHRILNQYLQQNNASSDKGDLGEVGKHITFTEQRAEDAEKELKKVLLLQMLSEHIGDTMDTVVTGVVAFGVFVQCRKFGVEGLISLESLGSDEWNFNPKGHCVTGRNSGYNVSLGLKIKVRIISVNISARRLELAPAEPLVDSKKPSKGKSKAKHPRKSRGISDRNKGRRRNKKK